MTHTPNELEALLEQVRDASQPTQAERARTRAAVFAAIASGQVSDTVQSVDASMQARAAGSGASGTMIVASKVAAGIVVAGLVAWSMLGSSTREQAQPAVVVTHVEKPPVNAVHAVDAPKAVNVQDASPVPVVLPPSAPEQAPVARTRRERARTTTPTVVLDGAAKTPAAQTPVATPVVPQLGEELRLIGLASESLRKNDLARARAALSEHAQRFARGELSHEREALSVLVQCAQGTTQAALAARAAFLRASGNSPLAERVRRACSAPVVEGDQVP